MALFFDLSIPYLERDEALALENKTLKAARLKAVVRAMEIGYAGVAYDRPFRGVLSDSDRCRIPPFPLSSLLSAAPALAAAAGFHRSLVGAPLSSPFHQYSRLTVSVDSAAAASALNSGNSILRSYDLVAARPVNQLAFDHACKVSEVDLIAINFSQKLPFRLKRPMVEAAIERGVHFEITYSHLIVDVHVRRQMLSDAKLLVDWTRRKNLIISSGASTVNEIRGPYDVTNLSVFLLGLSMERAKAAISKNCRSLIENALRKKHYYKEAIRIERILSDNQLDSKKAWYVDMNDWNPISSEEGDLPSLDVITKCFADAGKLPIRSSAINFMPIVDGTKATDQASKTDNLLLSCASATSFFSPIETGSHAAESDVRSSLTNNNVNQQDMLIEVPAEKRISINGCEINLISPSDTSTLFANMEESDPAIVQEEDPKNADDYNMVDDAAEILSDTITIKDCNVVSEVKPITFDPNPTNLSADDKIEPVNISLDGISVVQDATVTETQKVPLEIVGHIPNDAGDHISMDKNEESYTFFKINAVPGEQRIATISEKEKKDQPLCANGVPLKEHFLDFAQVKQGEGQILSQDDFPSGDTFHQMKEQEPPDVIMLETSGPLNEVLVKIEEQRKDWSFAADGAGRYSYLGRVRRKEKSSYPAYPLPFKGLFKPMFFKKKVRKNKKT